MGNDRNGMMVALVDWSQLIEDYLDNIGISFESFRREMSGGWMFGYIEALRRAGIRTTLFCVSARYRVPTRFKHEATGATLCVLPAPKAYRLLRGAIVNPYAATIEEAVGDVREARRVMWSALKAIMPYLSTPLTHLRREMRREGCDVILCQDYEHERFDACALLGHVTGLPMFATFQGGNVAPRDAVRLRIRRWSLNRCAGLIVAPRAEAERVRKLYGVPRRKIRRIFNPLDVSEWRTGDRAATRSTLGIPAGARVAAWHGRVIVKRKGLDVLLEAWEQLCLSRGEADESRLLMIGDGHDREALREMIALSPAGHKIIRVDEYVLDRARLRALLLAADVYVFPSREEGFPVAPIEAMACALPVVAARATGVEDIFEGGEESGGIVVECGDSAELAEGLRRVFDDAALRRRLGANALEQARNRFSLEAVGNDLRAFMEERVA